MATMATSLSRQDRQFMRQRGAGSRAVDNVDFGFTFGTPVATQRARSRTPHPPQHTVRQHSKTPASSRREKPIAPNDDFDLVLDAVEFQNLDNTRLTKRRRVSENNGPEDISSAIIAAETESAPVSRSNNSETIDPSLLVNPIQHYQEKENIPPSEKRPTQTRRRRKRVIPAGLRPKKRQSGRSVRASGGPSVANEEASNSIGDDSLQMEAGKTADAVGDAEYEGSSPGISAESSNGFAARRTFGRPITASADESGRHITDQRDGSEHRQSLQPESLQKHERPQSMSTKRGVRGTASVKSRKQPSGSGSEVESQDDIERASRQAPLTVKLDDEDPAESTMQTIELPYAAPTSKVQIGHSRGFSMAADDDEEDEDYVDVGRRQQRKRKWQPSRPIRKNRLDETDSRPKPSGLPILTHRMGNVHALPTIHETEPLQDGSDDELQVRSHDSNAPNAVDVLAQICREIIATAAERRSTQSSKADGNGARQKKNGLDSFGGQLDVRLFDMSTAVHNRLHLEARVRALKREKAELQARWIEVRNQRGQIALKCDSIRRRHWNNEAQGRRKWDISQLAQEVEVQSGRDESAQENVEYLLRSVAADTSNDGASGGFLRTIQGFNGQLERLMEALEDC